MFITTASVAGAAAFFSVYGLSHTFTAAFWSVVFMGGALEAGKLMTASYLYRFSNSISTATKILGTIFVFCLMVLTSLGIYGYLANAYQSGSTDMKHIDSSIMLKREEQVSLQKRKTDIDSQIAQVNVKDVRGKQRLMKQFAPEVETINARLIAITSELQKDTDKQITTDSHVGPIVFVARIIGIQPDQAINFLILLIIFAFDPLAIFLTIATNNAVSNRSKQTKQLLEQQEESNVGTTVPPATEILDLVATLEKDPNSKSDMDNAHKWVTENVEYLPKLHGSATKHDSEDKYEDRLFSLQPMSEEDTYPQQYTELSLVPIEHSEYEAPVPTTGNLVEGQTEIVNEVGNQKLPTNDMVQKFYQRQQLIKNIRSGNLN